MLLGNEGMLNTLRVPSIPARLGNFLTTKKSRWQAEKL